MTSRPIFVPFLRRLVMRIVFYYIGNKSSYFHTKSSYFRNMSSYCVQFCHAHIFCQISTSVLYQSYFNFAKKDSPCTLDKSCACRRKKQQIQVQIQKKSNEMKQKVHQMKSSIKSQKF